jgi:multidrug efflux pump subunit AcrA (membrane-fusion protein)
VSGTLTELTVKAGDTVAAGTVLARIDDTDARSAVTAAQTQVDNAQEAVTRAEASSTQSSQASTCTANAAFRLDASPGTSAPASPSPSASTGSPTNPQPSAPGHATTTAPGGGGAPRTGSTGGADGCPTGGAGSTGNNRGATTSTDSLFSAQQQLNNALHTLAQQQTKLAGTVITAPVAGRVLSVGGVIGSSESPSSTGFIVLAGTSDVAVKAQFTEAEVPKLALGQHAKITLPNLADQEFTGTVTQIDPAGTISSKLVRYAALIAFDKLPETLLFGQTANVAVVTASSTDVVAVPVTALTDRNGSTATVTVRTSSGTGHRTTQRTVQVGLLGDVSAEITAGLSEGEEVLTVGR